MNFLKTKISEMTYCWNIQLNENIQRTNIKNEWDEYDLQEIFHCLISSFLNVSSSPK